MSTLHHESLPVELWLEIFTQLGLPYTLSHAPFQPVPGASELSVNPYTTIVLVCKNWRAWASELLYRNVRISNVDLKLPEGMGGYRTYGQWVRRVVVPYSTTVTERCNKPMVSNEILDRCPNLEVLVRPHQAPNYSLPRSLRFDFDASCPAVASLAQEIRVVEPPRGFKAPNIEYLFIGSRISGFTPFYDAAIHLPNLRTLRLCIASPTLLRQIIYRWSFPNVENMILDSPIPGSGMEMIWESVGAKLRAVEFGNHSRFLFNQTLTPCLRACTSLQEINYYVFATLPPETGPSQEFSHPSVTSVGLHVSEYQEIFVEAEATRRRHLESHLNVFMGNTFPNLERLRLFGTNEWRTILSAPHFVPIQQHLKDRGCLVEFPDTLSS
ncbi:hypothetical protein C8J57DRAFT_1490236 [Mycena rebaudengoi]|nr:hypothetical protein C8J57DRAFT_1490236 [Mycena rebaudengoi]